MIKNIFKYKINHKGSIAIEAVLLTPLVFITFIIILYFFFMILTYIYYNNLANLIAQELNMRQTGYIEYKDKESLNYSMPQIMTYNFDGSILDDEYLRGASYKILNDYKDRFTIPFSEVVGINIFTTDPIGPNLGEKLSGTIIIVNIEYNFLEAFTKVFNTSNYTINAYGYSILI